MNSTDFVLLSLQPDPISKSLSREIFKKKRGRNKKGSIGGGPSSVAPPTVTNATMIKQYTLQPSQGSAAGLLGAGEDPAVVVINPHPPTSSNQIKEKRTKICCLL